MFDIRYRTSKTNLVFLRNLVVAAIIFGSIFCANSNPAPDEKTRQIIEQVVLELREVNPNVEITNEMIADELRKKSNQEQLLLDKERREHKALSDKNRALEKKIIENAIKAKDTEPLQRLMVEKYNISSLEALNMIMEHDERAYIVLREIIMNAQPR